MSLLMPGFSACGPQGTSIAGKGRGRTSSPGPAASAFTQSEAQGRGSRPRGGMRAPKALHRQLPLCRTVLASPTNFGSWGGLERHGNTHVSLIPRFEAAQP